MNPSSLRKLLRSTGAGALILSATIAWADKPEFAGGPHGGHDGNWHGEKHEKWERHGDGKRHDDWERHGDGKRHDDWERHGEHGHRDQDARWPDGVVVHGPHVRNGWSAPPAKLHLEPGFGHFFGDGHWHSIHDFYAPRLAAGHCPPGLKKKGMACLPPGHDRIWIIGQPLPVGVISYPLPVELRLRLGPPPPGYEYVRIAGDVLLIAIGTSLVIDAIEDLGLR